MTELDGQQVGTTPQSSVNDTGHNNAQGLNTFDLNHYNALTARFGDVTPFLSVETAPRDSIRFANNHELRTMTLKAPLLSPVRMHKSYFHVPLKALMPNTWDLLIKNPKRGDDLPDNFLPKMDFKKLFRNILYRAKAAIEGFSYADPVEETDPTPMTMDFIDENFFISLCLLRNAFSNGSLLRTLQLPIFWQDMAEPDFDVHFNNVISTIFDVTKYDDGEKLTLFLLDENGNSFISLSTENSGGFPLVGPDSVAEFFNCMESGLYGEFDNASSADPFPADVRTSLRYFVQTLDAVDYQLDLIPTENLLMSPLKLFAYHMACAQFFTNDNVDDITNAKEWLLNFRTMAGADSYYQDINGVRYRPDPAAKIVLDSCISAVKTYYGEISNQVKAILNLLTFESSLKYGDYFNGARLRPLAVGDVNIDVNDDGSGTLYVEALDVTKNLAMQKFLNAVHKLSSNIAQYTKGIFGVTTGVIDPQPQFVARSTTFIGNPETINTSESQGNITSSLQSVDGKYEFNAQFQDFGYLMGFLTFDVIPCYPYAVDRNNYHMNRFDFFNPMLQNIGDQEVKFTELNYNSAQSRFAYQQRYAEYKNSLNVCSGGFAIKNRNDRAEYGITNWLYRADANKPLDPYFIRHHRTDFDRFYEAMDGIGLATYFHFALILNQQLTANRAMQYQSTIL